ncbi:MAG: MOSC domain-containing protein [Hyphomicrobiales bacterium]|nr:MAG: MOSC domain-containing protein [Hyphomicrobiales bacterium]
MRLLAVCIGHPETLPGKRYKTGINKHPVLENLRLGADGVEGDAVCDRRYHGGIDQAVYVEGSISLRKWSEELGRQIAYGEFGENLVIENLDNDTIAVGDRLMMGDIVLEATAPRMPCATFAAKMSDPQFVKRYRNAQRPGFYCRVVKGGTLSVGTCVGLEAYRGIRITMPQMMRDYGKRVSGDYLAAYLSTPIHHKLRASLVTGKVKF